MSILSNTLNSFAQPNQLHRKIVICTHAKHSSVELCRMLLECDAEITFYPVDYSKDPIVIDELLSIDVEVIEQLDKLIPIIEAADCAIEDGARISKIIDEHNVKVRKEFYSVEQTSGGIRYFEENAPQYPVINVAMSAVKLHIENKLATPEGVLQCFSRATGTLLSGKNILIIGYGSIGEGLARLARTVGAHVTVYDSFATKRLFAKHQGLATVEKRELDQCITKQDVIFMATNTYQGSLIGIEQILLMRDGASICNAGSGRGEITLELQNEGNFNFHDAKVAISQQAGNLVVECTKLGSRKTVTILAEAFPINLHFGDGTSHDAIEVVMALLLLALLYGPNQNTPGLQALSNKIQETIAEIAINSDTNVSELEPTYIKSKQLKKTTKPYGGIYPFHNELGSLAKFSVARVIFQPAAKTRGHYHKQTQESYFVMSGTANILVWSADGRSDVQTWRMEAGDYLLVPEKYFHDVKVTSKENFECLVIASPPFQPWDQFFIKEEEA